MSDLLRRMLLSHEKLRRLAWRIGRRIYASARAEQQELEIESDGEVDLMTAVIRSVGQNCVVFDVGANQGDWSERFLLEFNRLVGEPSGRLKMELFEPVPATRSRLEASMEQYCARQVVRINALALSDRSGSFEMAIMSESGGTNSLHFDGLTAQPPGGWVRVETMPLDHFCSTNSIQHIDLLKCDTEGHDSKVLHGAAQMLKAGAINVVQFEYNHRWVFGRAFLKDVFDLIAGTPYQLGKLTPGGVELYDCWHMELERYFQSNYVLIHKRALPWIPARRGSFDVSNTYALSR